MSALICNHFACFLFFYFKLSLFLLCFFCFVYFNTASTFFFIDLFCFNLIWHLCLLVQKVFCIIIFEWEFWYFSLWNYIIMGKWQKNVLFDMWSRQQCDQSIAKTRTKPNIKTKNNNNSWHIIIRVFWDILEINPNCQHIKKQLTTTGVCL